MKPSRTAFACSLLLEYLLLCCGAPHAPGEFVLVEEVLRLNAMDGKQNNVSATLITLSESSDEDGSIASNAQSTEQHATDDLIFLAHRTQKQLADTPHTHHIDLPTSDEEDSVASHTHEASARTTVANGSSDVNAAVAPIDMSAFVVLIPTQEVKTIANNYYRHDAEVQRAYAFLSSSHFAEMKLQLLQQPEVVAFTRYLNNSGLDVVHLLQLLSQAISPPALSTQELVAAAGNEVAATPVSISTDAQETSTKDQLNGLHGLVDSVLEVLPQDQILATFFDKMEADGQFSRLVDSIGTPAFAKILSNLQNSLPLRNLIFVLHNNGIYVARIVDSLKSYFFLASF